MKKKALLLLLTLCLVVTGCAKGSSDSDGTDLESVELTDQQEMITAQITAIYGNEISYTVVEEASNSDMENKKPNRVMYSLTDETGNVIIPVGTKVVTALGVTTTFSRLAVEDVIQMLMEKDADGKEVVVGVWIVA